MSARSLSLARPLDPPLGFPPPPAMGALTDSRKRLSADHRLPIPSSPPPSKRPKLAPFPSLDPSTSAAPPPHPSPQINHASAANAPGPSSSSAPASSSSSLPQRRRLPPPPPFQRPIHGPQRVLRAFRHGNPARPHAARPSWFPPSSPPPQSLGLEQYVELVNSVSQPALPTRAATTNAAATQEEAVPLEVVDIEEAGDERKQQDEEEEEEEAVRGSVVVRKVPLYKELYEASGRKRDAKLKTLEFEVRLAEEGRLGLERLAEVLPRITPKEVVPEPFVPLTDEDEEIVRQALHGRNSRERLVVHEPSNIMITREILQCLNNQEWLNDEVINLYLDLLKERELREPSKFLKCHFFNTFFYKKLISGSYDYKAVRRWTTKRKLGYSLIECDKIFVPIHKEVHWCLAVINIREKKFQYLDSLGSMDMKVLRTLARYIVDEVKDKSGQQIDALSWKQEGVKHLPLQENGWDCGMFMLKYIDFYSRDMDLSFGQKHMRYFRRRTAKEILNLRAE
ncbi:hypothetical protein BS78_03G154700 [Paspalum vaginatum]|nr:hypothetical protein BS78_03G154700 [Paspalum vaginatum]